MISEHASPLAMLGGADAGGQNVYVANLARQLAAMGHTIDIFTRRDDPGVPATAPLCDEVEVIQVDAGPAAPLPKEALLPHMDAFGRAMRRLLREAVPYDVIHAHFFMSAMVACDLGKAFDLPVVVTFHALGKVRRLHQGERDGFPDARLAIEERIVADADRIVAECPEDEADLIRLYGAQPDRIRLAPCGVDLEEFPTIPRDVARARLGIPADAKLALQLGRLVPRKGIDIAIGGLARANRVGIDARLMIVGGPDDAEVARLTARAQAEGVADRVMFTGPMPREALALYYAAADVFVTTPWYEPFGITPLEAMACERPVIASDVGGLRYSVAHGETGFLVPPHDPAAVGRKLVELFTDPAAARAMGRAGRVRVGERFTWRSVGLQIEEIYRELLAKRAAPPAIVADDPVGSAFSDLSRTLLSARNLLGDSILAAADAIGDALLAGRKVLVCGNGGSAADAQHFAAEFMGRYRLDGRRALPVIALNADPCFLTAWANDVGFEDVFARQVRALGEPGDVLVVLSTSGRSPNVLAALGDARAKGLTTIALLGGGLNPAIALAEVALRVPSTDTPRIQEVQTLLLHLLCELVEARVASEDAASAAPVQIVEAAS